MGFHRRLLGEQDSRKLALPALAAFGLALDPERKKKAFYAAEFNRNTLNAHKCGLRASGGILSSFLDVTFWNSSRPKFNFS